LVQCRGKGGGGQPGSLTAVQPAAICNLTAHSIHCFLTNQCATATLHVATLAHANATSSYPQDVCKLSERACNANIWRQNKLRTIQIIPEMKNLSAYAFADGYFYTTTPTLILLLKAMSSAHVKLAASHCSHTEMSKGTAWIQHA